MLLVEGQPRGPGDLAGYRLLEATDEEREELRAAGYAIEG